MVEYHFEEELNIEQTDVMTGDYLGITQPSALCLIKKELKNQVDLRFYNEKGRSFHPKAYIFHQKAGSEIFIGSSNISRSALTSGIEWNYRFDSRRDQRNFQLFYETFEDLFYHHSIIVDDEELRRYSRGWKRPSVAKDLERYDEAEAAPQIVEIFSPGARRSRLYTRWRKAGRKGRSKGLYRRRPVWEKPIWRPLILRRMNMFFLWRTERRF